jgi:hypothetical protein
MKITTNIDANEPSRDVYDNAKKEQIKKQQM